MRTREDKLEYNRRYQILNKEKISARKKARAAEAYEISKKWKLEHAELVKAYDKKSKDNNREKRRIASTAASRKRREYLINGLGGKCIICGYDNKLALQIDHINGGGTKIRKLNYNSYYKDMANAINSGETTHIQLLCANCNWLKRTEYTDPHKSIKKYNYYDEIKNEIIELLGSRCATCEHDDIRVLHVDHINGGGTQERKLFTSMEMYFRYVLYYLKHECNTRYQLLCANCNSIKRHTNHEWNPRGIFTK